MNPEIDNPLRQSGDAVVSKKGALLPVKTLLPNCEYQLSCPFVSAQAFGFPDSNTTAVALSEMRQRSVK